MLIPIESICLIPVEPDGDLEFAAVFAAEEIEHFSGIRPSIAEPSATSKFHYSIVFARSQKTGAGSQDSYFLSSSDNSLTISSPSKRGLLFACGRFLRLSPLREGCLEIPSEFDLKFTPYSRIRGHQVGYGNLSNSMDSWTVAQFDRHIRDLILFGCNWIEIEYKTDSSPHHKFSIDEMNAAISGIAARYDLDCTVWIPNWGDESNYLNPETAALEFTSPDGLTAATTAYYQNPRSSSAQLADRRRIFSAYDVSAITVPGGDPGSLRPHILFPWVERLTEELGSCGRPPFAWISAQWMRADPAWYDSFFEFANRKPSWLKGIVHGPWTQLSIPELRRRLRDDLPIRRYDDLTHCFFCQYPVADWDIAHAMTAGREPINPRPKAYKQIHNLYCHDAIGSTPHTTGINADINTFVWLDQEWDPKIEVEDTLRDYARVFLDSSLEENFPDAILALERNWEGPLIANHGVGETLDLWKQLENSVKPDILKNWRFQSPLLRAFYDAYIQKRLIRETDLENRAVSVLSSNRSVKAIEYSLNLLKETSSNPIASELRQKCITLSEELNQSIGLKSSVEKHGAAQKGRGAFMDAIEAPLNDSMWLIHQLEKAADTDSEPERDACVASILGRTDPGEGGLYDNLGTPAQIGRFMNAVDFKVDPGGLAGSRFGSGIALEGMPGSQTLEIKLHEGQPIPLAWLTCAEAIYDTPLIIEYEGLDDSKAYELRVVYPSRIGKNMKLIANSNFVVHERITTGDEAIKSFHIPSGIVREGRLQLEWTGERVRGIQVAELWLTPENL